MGEDLDLIDVDMRQRKSGKNKNQHDDIGISGGGGGGDGGHGSSKRRRRGRGGGDRSEGIKVIPEEEVPSESKDKKVKVPITKKQTDSDDEVGDEGDDAYYSSLEDEESSGSWLFKLIIIAIIVSLGFSLIWFNDGSSSSSTDLDGIDADVEPLSDIETGYIHEKVTDDDDEDRIQSNFATDETQHQGYQDHDGQEYNQEWSQGYGDSDRPEIIAEVSETIGQGSSELNDETEYREPRDEGYFGTEATSNGHQESMGGWTNEQDSQPEQVEESLIPFPETEIENHQNDQSYEQQSWHYQEQVDPPSEEPHQQFDPQTEQHLSYDPYEHANDEQLTKSTYETSPETVDGDQYYECPEGSHWDGLSCVNPESFVPMDEFNNGHEQPPQTAGENIYHQEHQ